MGVGPAHQGRRNLQTAGSSGGAAAATDQLPGRQPGRGSRRGLQRRQQLPQGGRSAAPHHLQRRQKPEISDSVIT